MEGPKPLLVRYRQPCSFCQFVYILNFLQALPVENPLHRSIVYSTSIFDLEQCTEGASLTDGFTSEGGLGPPEDPLWGGTYRGESNGDLANAKRALQSASPTGQRKLTAHQPL